MSKFKYSVMSVCRIISRLTKQKAKLEELLSGVNAFNAKGKAAEIGAFLDKYIPAVEQMHTTLKKYNTAFTVTIAENKKLKKKKQMTNTRSSGSDEALRLSPPKILSLEQALEFIDTDELLEVTPKSLRIRKKILDPTMRKRAGFRKS